MRLGVDVSLIARFEGKEDLAKRILSPFERAEYERRPDKAEYLSSRFSAKEAYVKATGRKDVDYRQVEVRNEKDGKPVLYVEGKKAEALLSISHDTLSFVVLILFEKGESL